MFDLVLNGTDRIDVNYRDQVLSYALDGSFHNPLEATYSALAACTGVFALKACRELGISDAGILVSVKPVARLGNPFFPSRIATAISFPEHISEDQRKAIMASVEMCAVKNLIKNGPEVEFILNVRDLA